MSYDPSIELSQRIVLALTVVVCAVLAVAVYVTGHQRQRDMCRTILIALDEAPGMAAQWYIDAGTILEEQCHVAGAKAAGAMAACAEIESGGGACQIPQAGETQ